MTENYCKDGSLHEWRIKENDEWTDTAVEGGKTVVTVRYLAKTRKCLKCRDFEVIDGTAVTRSGSEFMLEKDGTWGMGIS